MYLSPFCSLFSDCFFNSSLFLSFFVLFPCYLMTFFSVRFIFLSMDFFFVSVIGFWFVITITFIYNNLYS